MTDDPPQGGLPYLEAIWAFAPDELKARMNDALVKAGYQEIKDGGKFPYARFNAHHRRRVQVIGSVRWVDDGPQHRWYPDDEANQRVAELNEAQGQIFNKFNQRLEDGEIVMFVYQPSSFKNPEWVPVAEAVRLKWNTKKGVLEYEGREWPGVRCYRREDPERPQGEDGADGNTQDKAKPQSKDIEASELDQPYPNDPVKRSCYEFLIKEFETAPRPPPAKPALWQTANKEFNIRRRAFNAVWDRAVEKYPDRTCAGRPRN